MKIIIIGCGKIGTRILENVSKEGHDIVVVDNRYDKIQEIIEKFDVMGVCGNGATLSILKEAGAKGADLVIATTESDELNILTCLIAKKAGAKQAIPRVREPEYINQLILMKEELGLSMIVNPEASTAEEIANIIAVPSIVKIEHFAKNKINLFEIVVEENSVLIGKSLIEIGKSYSTKVLICAVQREDEVLVPTGRFVVQEGDHLHICAKSENLIQFLTDIDLYTKPIKKALIIGGGRITHYLLNDLIKRHISPKVIEINRDKANQLAEAFPKATIICGDGTNHELLLEEGIESTDAFISLASIDEENIITSMYANKFDIKKVITKIKRNTFGDIISDLGIASVVNSTDVAADKIISYIRALENTRGSNIVTLYKLVNGSIEAIQFDAKHSERFYGIPLKDLELIDGCIIAAIYRNGEVIIPGGLDTIELNDDIIVITTTNSLTDLSEIIK